MINYVIAEFGRQIRLTQAPFEPADPIRPLKRSKTQMEELCAASNTRRAKSMYVTKCHSFVLKANYSLKQDPKQHRSQRPNDRPTFLEMGNR